MFENISYTKQLRSVESFLQLKQFIQESILFRKLRYSVKIIVCSVNIFLQ